MPERRFIEAASAALVWDGHVLLIRRAREPARGLLAFPGGRLLEGETAEDAARREVAEETGLHPGRLTYLRALQIPGGAEHFRLHVFWGTHEGGTPIAGDDADHAAWYRLEELAGAPITSSSLELARFLLEETAGSGK